MQIENGVLIVWGQMERESDGARPDGMKKRGDNSLRVEERQREACQRGQDQTDHHDQPQSLKPSASPSLSAHFFFFILPSFPPLGLFISEITVSFSADFLLLFHFSFPFLSSFSCLFRALRGSHWMTEADFYHYTDVLRFIKKFPDWHPVATWEM